MFKCILSIIGLTCFRRLVYRVEHMRRLLIYRLNLFQHGCCLLGYAMGWGPITWLLMSEVLPLVARGVASGLCVTVSWLTAFMLTHAFTYLVDSYGLYVPYLGFTVVCVLCLLFTAVCIPETRGRSLEEIENYFRTGRTFTISRSPSLMQST